MTNSNITQFDLQQVHLALRISTPLEQVSPMVLYTLTVIARCWRGRVPANLWAEAHHAAAPRPAPALPTGSTDSNSFDYKRRASGDFE